ncbi:outer membrane beta-barrel protein [Pannonibacter sp. Pt2-lr]
MFDGETTYDAPLGLRVGTFTVVPQLTVSGAGRTMRPALQAGVPTRSILLHPICRSARTGPGISWMYRCAAPYAAYPGSSVQSQPSIDTRAALRLDAGDSTQINSSLGHSYSREDTSTAENPNGEGDVNVVNASLGVTREAGIVAATLRGDVARTMYSEGQSREGRSGRDNTLYSATLRLDARTGAMLQPFAEVTGLRRSFDEDCAAPCIRRDASGYALRSGVTIAAGPKLAGEVAAGWRVERLDSRQLQDLAGLTIDGSLVWSPTRLTTVTAGLTTTLSPSDLAGSSGSILYSADLRVSHALSERLVAQAGAGYARRHYQGWALKRPPPARWREQPMP